MAATDGIKFEHDKVTTFVRRDCEKRHDGANPGSKYNKNLAREVWPAFRDGYFFFTEDKHMFFVYRDGSQWDVIDPDTGMQVTHGRTRQAAAESLDPMHLAKFDEYAKTDKYRFWSDVWHDMTKTGDHIFLSWDGNEKLGRSHDGRETWDYEEAIPEPEETQSEQEQAKEPRPEPSPAKPREETRPERFNREFGEAYDAILRLQEEYNPGHPEHVTDSGVEWNDLSVAIRALTLVGERFMREHPRMLGKFYKWRGDMFTSDREVAALGMVGTRWLEETERRRAEQTA